MITTDGEPLEIGYTDDQKDLFFNKEDHHYFSIAQKGRRFGGTHGGSNLCIERLIKGEIILWVDVVQGNLNAYYEIFFLPILRKIKPQYWNYNKTEKVLHLLNGRLDMRSAEKPERIEGFQYNLIILNEAGIILKGLKGRYLWQNAILPMTLQTKKDKTPEVYFIGTPKGKRSKKDEKHISDHSLYYELAQRGLSNSEDDKRWRTVKYSTYDNPLLSKEDISELERQVPPQARAQELHGEFVDLNNEAIFKRHWFSILDKLPEPQHWQRLIISGDTAFKAKESNDNSAFGLILEFTLGYLVIDVIFGKYEFPDLCNRIKEFYNYHNCRYFDKNISYVCVEDKASGQSLIQTLQRETKINIKPLPAKGDKVERANNILPTCESGRVHLLKGAWNDDFLGEICEFNAAMDTPDDQVDMFTHGIGHLQKSVKTMPASAKIERKSSSLRRKGYYG